MKQTWRKEYRVVKLLGCQVWRVQVKKRFLRWSWWGWEKEYFLYDIDGFGSRPVEFTEKQEACDYARDMVLVDYELENRKMDYWHEDECPK